MKKKNQRIKNVINSLGAGARETYLEFNPHGFSCVHKTHINKKKYSRKIKVKFD